MLCLEFSCLKSINIMLLVLIKFRISYSKHDALLSELQLGHICVYLTQLLFNDLSLQFIGLLVKLYVIFFAKWFAIK